MNIKLIGTKEIIAVVLIASLFLVASYVSQQFAGNLENAIAVYPNRGILLYVGVVITTVLIPFATTLPLIPVAVNAWGNALAAGLTLVGWISSATIAFVIAQKVSKVFVQKLLSFKNIKHFSDLVPRQNLFWGTIALGLIGAPIDLVAYTIGLFTNMRLDRFVIAITLGLAPFAFFLSYTASLSIVRQTYVMVSMVILWVVVYSYLKHKAEKENGGAERAGTFNKLNENSRHRNKL